MAVVVIIGILASLSLIGYRKTVERGYWREAQDQLMTIYYGERSYFFSNDDYLTVPEGSGAATWRQIYVDNPGLSTAGNPVVFSATRTAGPPNATFTATARRNGGPCNNLALTIDQTGPPIADGWLVCINGL